MANHWLHELMAKFEAKLNFIKQRGRELSEVAKAEAVETGLPGIGSGPADAWRHARWNQLMAEEMGALNALMVSIGHEIFDNQVTGQQTFADFKMDMHNNFVGALSGEHPDVLLGTGRLTTVVPPRRGGY